jgi:hypothetical protein
MAFVMVHELLLARVEFQIDLFANTVKFDPAADSLPPEVEMRVAIGGLFPKLSPLLQCNFDQPRVVTGEYCEPQLEGVRRWS